MNTRTLFIYMRYFWPVVPGVLAALFVAWLFWGMGPVWMWFFVVPAVAGLGVFLLFVWVQIAAGVGISGSSR